MKVMRTITLDSEIDSQLKMESNASGLIERLLRTHFDLKVLEESVIDVEELDAKAKELNLQLEQVNSKKKEALSQDEVEKKLKKYGITNKFLITRLKKMKDQPNVFVARSLKDQYELPEIIAIYKAWNVLHGIEEEDDEDQD